MSAATFTFDEASHLYRDDAGAVVLSTTQVLKSAGMISFDGVPPSILEHKRQLGSLVHKVTEMWERGENLAEYDIPDEVWPYFQGYVAFRNDCNFAPELIEHQTLAELHGMKWGMTLDRMGTIDGVPHVIELKCGAKHPAHGVQLASYDTGLNGREKYARASVQLGPDFPRGYKVHIWEDSSDYQVWIAALAVSLWKHNNKTLTVEDVPERLVG